MANTPESTIRDGNIKATIWKNFGDSGNFYTVTLARSFKNEAGDWKETSSFSGSQLLRIARLADRAYDRTGELRRGDEERQQAAATGTA